MESHLQRGAQPYLLPDGDAAAPSVGQDPAVAQVEVSFVGDAADADLSRVDIYPLRQTSLIVNWLFQGGERFGAVTLTGPGAAGLFQRVGIQPRSGAFTFVPEVQIHLSKQLTKIPVRICEDRIIPP